MLKTYMYCGVYYEQHLLDAKAFPLIDSRSPEDIMIASLIKWLFLYKANYSTVPGEHDIMLRIVTVKQKLKEAGYPILFASHLNNINLAILELRQIISNIRIKQCMWIQRYVHAGTSVTYNILAIDDNDMWLISNERSRFHYMNSPEWLMPVANNDTHLNYKVFTIKDGGYSLTAVEHNSVNQQAATAFCNKLLTAYSNDINLPIYQCEHTTCPYRRDCQVAT